MVAPASSSCEDNLPRIVIGWPRHQGLLCRGEFDSNGNVAHLPAVKESLEVVVLARRWRSRLGDGFIDSHALKRVRASAISLQVAVGLMEAHRGPGRRQGRDSLLFKQVERGNVCLLRVGCCIGQLVSILLVEPVELLAFLRAANG